jgi:hypothetical protein
MEEILQLITGPGGALVMALVVLFGGWKCWWVFGWHYKQVVNEKNEWKEAALRGTYAAQRAVEIAADRKETES